MISEQQKSLDEVLYSAIQEVIRQKAINGKAPVDTARFYETLSIARGMLGIVDADEILAFKKEAELGFNRLVSAKRISWGWTINDRYFKLTEHANQQKEQEIP